MVAVAIPVIKGAISMLGACIFANERGKVMDGPWEEDVIVAASIMCGKRALLFG